MTPKACVSLTAALANPDVSSTLPAYSYQSNLVDANIILCVLL